MQFECYDHYHMIIIDRIKHEYLQSLKKKWMLRKVVELEMTTGSEGIYILMPQFPTCPRISSLAPCLSRNICNAPKFVFGYISVKYWLSYYVGLLCNIVET